MIKLVVTDMDGTFLNSKKQMHPQSFEIIEKLIEKGVYFVVASGRQYFNLYDRFNQNDKIIYASENGAYVVKNKEIINFSTMDKQIIKDVVASLENVENTHLVLSGKKSSYVKQMPNNIFNNTKEYYGEIQIVEDLTEIDDDICKIAIYNEFGTQQYVYDKVKKFKENYSVVVSAFEWLDIFNNDVNKGKAVELLQEKFNIKKDEIMVFGDYLNDYELIQSSEESYVVSNGHEKLKSIAKYIIGSNDDFSVIETIKEKFDL